MNLPTVTIGKPNDHTRCAYAFGVRAWWVNKVLKLFTAMSPIQFFGNSIVKERVGSKSALIILFLHKSGIHFTCCYSWVWVKVDFAAFNTSIVLG